MSDAFYSVSPSRLRVQQRSLREGGRCLVVESMHVPFPSSVRPPTQPPSPVAQAAALLHGAFHQVHPLEAGPCCRSPSLCPLSISSAPFHLNSTHPLTRHLITLSLQTVFYLREPLTVCAGEQLTGSISSAPNARNKRDLDIKIEVAFEGRHSQCQLSQDFRLR